MKLPSSSSDHLSVCLIVICTDWRQLSGIFRHSSGGLIAGLIWRCQGLDWGPSSQPGALPLSDPHPVASLGLVLPSVVIHSVIPADLLPRTVPVQIAASSSSPGCLQLPSSSSTSALGGLHEPLQSEPFPAHRLPGVAPSPCSQHGRHPRVSPSHASRHLE